MPYFLHPLWKTTLGSLTEEQLWEHYDKCLRAHDWTFEYSDDHGVWRAGTEERDHIAAIRKILSESDEDAANKLYWKYSPFLNEDGSFKSI